MAHLAFIDRGQNNIACVEIGVTNWSYTDPNGSLEGRALRTWPKRPQFVCLLFICLFACLISRSTTGGHKESWMPGVPKGLLTFAIYHTKPFLHSIAYSVVLYCVACRWIVVCGCRLCDLFYLQASDFRNRPTLP